jgi:hypothetical protein
VADFDQHTPKDAEVFALSQREDYPRAEFVVTLGADGAEHRVAWRIYDRHGKGLLLTDQEVRNLSKLQRNYDTNA